MYLLRINDMEIVVSIADTFFSRLKGLMGRKEMNENEAMLLVPCNGIHTFFMRFTIDAIFLSEDNHVLSYVSEIPPWSLWMPVRGSHKVLELKGGMLNKLLISKGQRLELASPDYFRSSTAAVLLKIP